MGSYHISLPNKAVVSIDRLQTTSCCVQLQFLKKVTRVHRENISPIIMIIRQVTLSVIMSYYILVKSSNKPRVFLPIFRKAIRTISISVAFPNRPANQSSIQKTAKKNFLSCIWEALPNTLTPNFKIDTNLHWMVGQCLTL